VEKACLAALAKSARTGVDWSAQIQEWFHDWSALGWFLSARGIVRGLCTEASG
jgi:hypothetical protein